MAMFHGSYEFASSSDVTSFSTQFKFTKMIYNILEPSPVSQLENYKHLH